VNRFRSGSNRRNACRIVTLLLRNNRLVRREYFSTKRRYVSTILQGVRTAILPHTVVVMADVSHR
jgi:hypothetical protein